MNITCKYTDDLQKKKEYDSRQWHLPADPPMSHAAWYPTGHPTAMSGSWCSRPAPLWRKAGRQSQEPVFGQYPIWTLSLAIRSGPQLHHPQPPFCLCDQSCHMPRTARQGDGDPSADWSAKNGARGRWDLHGEQGLLPAVGRWHMPDGARFWEKLDPRRNGCCQVAQAGRTPSTERTSPSSPSTYRSKTLGTSLAA